MHGDTYTRWDRLDTYIIQSYLKKLGQAIIAIGVIAIIIMGVVYMFMQTETAKVEYKNLQDQIRWTNTH